MRKPTITFRAHNTVKSDIASKENTLPVKVESNQFIIPDMKGRAFSEPVQFNVNTGAVAGTIFVDENNDGVCVATIEEGNFVFSEGSAKLYSDGTSPNMENAVVVREPVILDHGTSIRFNVHRLSEAVGNVTFVFEVDYKLAL